MLRHEVVEFLLRRPHSGLSFVEELIQVRQHVLESGQLLWVRVVHGIAHQVAQTTTNSAAAATDFITIVRLSSLFLQVLEFGTRRALLTAIAGHAELSSRGLCCV